MTKEILCVVLGTLFALQSPAWAASGACAGDCDHDRATSVNELVTGVAIALGRSSLGTCSTLDVSADDAVTVDELIAAVGSLLDGCPYQATIRRTGFGIPHILADELGSLGFGQGYALAEDHLCTLADQVLKVRGERAEFFGPGDANRHLNSDLAYRALGVHERAEQSLNTLPGDAIDLLRGYAAGYNAYLAEVGADGVSGWCRGEAWVRPISAVDLLAYTKDVALIGSARSILDFISAATPPAGSSTAGAATRAPLAWQRPGAGGGSNGWAIGSDRSAGGRGMLVANPHFPWTGEARLWESQLTIPGELDVYGVSLVGFPGVNIGFNSHVAWTHTFDTGRHMTFYSLDLVPGKPTSYFYDGAERAMTARELTVQVRQPDDSLAEVRRTFYASHYGPIVDPGGLGWSTTRAYTVRDANIDDDALVPQWLAMGQASDMDAFQRIFAELQGIPWLNTMAADETGRAWYVDGSRIPNLSQAAIAAWLSALQTDPLTAVFDSLGATLLDGSHSLSEWVTTPGARAPGLVPFAAQPQLERRDYVFNSNDSHWLVNAETRLEGYSPLFGTERTARSPRTRLNALLLANTPAGWRFTLTDVQQRLLSNRSLTAELLADAIVARCDGASPVTADGQQVDLGAACAALAGWDRRFDAVSVGAVVFRELLARFEIGDFLNAGPLFANPFDAADPIGSPSGLAAPTPGSDVVLTALARGVVLLEQFGIPVDAPLGEWQYALRGGKIPLHGGADDREGVANVVVGAISSIPTTLEPADAVTGGRHDADLIFPSGLGDGGYVVAFGSSFVLTVAYTDAGPLAEAVLTYGESGDPDSPHFADQLPLFAQKQLRPVLFTEPQIADDPELAVYTVSAPAPVGS